MLSRVTHTRYDNGAQLRCAFFLSPSIAKAIGDNRCRRCPVAPLPESTPWDTNLPLNAKIGHLQWRQWNEARSLAGKPASCRNGWTAVLIFGCTYFVRKRRTGTGSSFFFCGVYIFMKCYDLKLLNF